MPVSSIGFITHTECLLNIQLWGLFHCVAHNEMSKKKLFCAHRILMNFRPKCHGYMKTFTLIILILSYNKISLIEKLYKDTFINVLCNIA